MIHRVKYSWHVWRQTKTAWLVLIQVKNSGQQFLFGCRSPAEVWEIHPTQPMPDLRVNMPVSQTSLPPTCRALVREAMEKNLVTRGKYTDRLLAAAKQNVKYESGETRETTHLYIPVGG